MRKLASAILFTAWIAPAQTPLKESDTLQTLLVEVRQLRQSIEGMTAAAQRVQIALYGVQLQDAAVARAAQRLDSARNKCQGMEEHRQHTSGEIARLENSLTSAAVGEVERGEARVRLPETKRELESQTAVWQTCQVAEAEASSQLQTDRAKLAELQERIARLDKALEQLGPAR